MSKYKALKKEQVEILSKDIERMQNLIEYEPQAWTSVGYVKATLKTLQKQLKGEFPII